MKLFILDVLESKGVTVPREHLDELATRGLAIEDLKRETEQALLDDYDIALRNMPGGDHA